MAAKSTKARRVICLSTGLVYSSINAAARAHELSPASVMRAIRHDRRCGGLFFTYAPEDITGEQLEKWRIARLLGCVSFSIGGENC